MEAMSWLQISVKWEVQAGKKGKWFEWENEVLVGTLEGPLEVCGHKFKVRSASTILYSTILGVSVETLKMNFHFIFSYVLPSNIISLGNEENILFIWELDDKTRQLISTLLSESK